MTQTINVLIIEDEPLIIEAWKNAFNYLSNEHPNPSFKIKSAKNCDNALDEIRKGIISTPFDLVLLDINIPPSSDKTLLCGEDIGLIIKEAFPQIKIMVFTSLNNNYRLNSILKSLNPDGFIIKCEICFQSLLEALKSVLDDEPYYSKTVLQLMRRHFISDFSLDKIDRQLLYHISKGSKMKHLTETILLSKSALELRKRNIKELFELENGDDRDLILKAESLGYI